MSTSHIRVLVALLALGLPPAAQVGSAGPDSPATTAQVAEAVRRSAASSVVRVVTSGYRPVEGAPEGPTPRVRRRETAGSGVVIDDRLIVTTSDLLVGADHVEVTLPGSEGEGRAARTVDATLVGLAPEVGLALLRADAAGLRPLAIARPGSLARGQVVFALTSVETGLPTVTIATVDAVALSMAPASATAWIQTGTPAEGAACGGPLVDAAGALVGLTACPQPAAAAGYAVPAAVVALSVPQLREFGHLHRARLGLTIEALTPQLRAGLGLGATPGVIVADVNPGGPADAAGLEAGDVLTALGGRSLAEVSIAEFSQQLLTLSEGQQVPLALERRSRAGVALVTAAVPDHDCARPTLVDLRHHLIEHLGIIGLPVGSEMASLVTDLGVADGVVVLWQIDSPRPARVALARGDVIHAVNGAPVSTPADVRERLQRLAPGDALVLQVARDGALTYLTASADWR